jgi:hypothetical protein
MHMISINHTTVESAVTVNVTGNPGSSLAESQRIADNPVQRVRQH